MGYRSNVMALVYPGTALDAPKRIEQYGMLKTLMNTTYKDVWEYLGDYFGWVDPKQVLVFQCDDIKWYESFPDIRAFESFIREVEELGYDTEFIRVGENYDDIEMRYSDNATYHLSVHREITCGV